MHTRNELAVLSEVLGPRFDPTQLTITGPEQGFASAFDITALAAGSIAAANLAAAELLSARTGGVARGVTVDRMQACAAFMSERLFSPEGWERPRTTGLINANYRCVDGWIRLHAAYGWHHAAALDALGMDRTVVDKSAIAKVIAGWRGEDLEAAVIAAGGCAALMRTPEEWDAHTAGSALAGAPAVVWAIRDGGRATLSRSPSRPMEGVRVLDLTRVIAGPTCTRFLAAQGARVLRIDPPGYTEIEDLLSTTTAGKKCAAVDLRSSEGAERLASLVAESDVLGVRLAFRCPGPDRLRRRSADLAQSGARCRQGQRLRLARTLARPPGLRQPRADEHWNCCRGATSRRHVGTSGAAVCGARLCDGLLPGSVGVSRPHGPRAER